MPELGQARKCVLNDAAFPTQAAAVHAAGRRMIGKTHAHKVPRRDIGCRKAASASKRRGLPVHGVDQFTASTKASYRHIRPPDCRTYLDDQLDALSVGVTGGACCPIWRSVRLWLPSSPKTARTLLAFTTTCRQSIGLTSANFLSKARCILSHIPVCVHSAKRWWQAETQPQLSALGSTFLPRPVRSTKRIPSRATRRYGGLRPGCFAQYGLGGGSNGSNLP